MIDHKKYKHNGETLNKFQKPLLLYLKWLSMFTEPGELVIDMTSGSGTTAVITAYNYVDFLL